MLLFVCLVSVVAASPLQTDKDWEGPEFCTRECPSFTTVKTEQNYEMRTYEPTKWISTEYSSNSTDDRSQRKQAFWSLFNYIRGENSQDVKIPMTVPVMTKIYVPCSEEGCRTTYIMSFYVPSALQADTPVPNESRLYIDNKPEMTVFVRSFTGWENYNAHEENIAALMEEVGDAANTESYYKAGYGPYKSPEAHNEVWLTVK